MTEAKNKKSTARQAADLFDRVQHLRAEKIEAIAEAGRKAEAKYDCWIQGAKDAAGPDVVELFQQMDARENGK